MVKAGQFISRCKDDGVIALKQQLQQLR